MKAKIISKGWLFVLLVFLTGCQPSSQESMKLFYQANTVYKGGNYDAALELYQGIVETGFVSAAVYYNIGNCYIKKNDLGHAILWYERALRINPRDGDLLANWRYAKSKMKNPEVFEKKDLIERFFYLPGITDDEIFMVLCLVLSGISAVVLAGLFLGWRFQKTFVFITILSVFFIFHVFSFCNKLGTYDNQAVVLSTAEVKYEPEERATTYFTAYEGWDLRILNESTGWVKVQRPDGLIGWLPRDLVERI